MQIGSDMAANMGKHGQEKTESQSLHNQIQSFHLHQRRRRRRRHQQAN